MTGCVVSWKCSVACLKGEESQQATSPQVRQRRNETQWTPASTHCWQTRASSTVAGGRAGRLVEVVAGVAPQHPGVAGLVPLVLVADGHVEHRLLHVEDREHVADDVAGHRAGAADLQHPLPLGGDHGQPDAGVDVAGRLLPGRGRQPLPGGEVAVLDALPDLVEDAVRVVGLHVLELLEAGLGGLLEHRGPGQRVVQRVGRGHPQGAGHPRQREALDEERARHDGERDEQQHLPVLGLLRDHEGRRQRDHAAHPGPAEDEGVLPRRQPTAVGVRSRPDQQVARREHPDHPQHHRGRAAPPRTRRR